LKAAIVVRIPLAPSALAPKIASSISSNSLLYTASIWISTSAVKLKSKTITEGKNQRLDLRFIHKSRNLEVNTSIKLFITVYIIVAGLLLRIEENHPELIF
jgi:hypothetical protein